MERLKAAQDEWYKESVEKKEQSCLITSTISRCKQGFRCDERSVTQVTDSNGRRYWAGTYT